eukprot:gene15098-16655_t
MFESAEKEPLLVEFENKNNKEDMSGNDLMEENIKSKLQRAGTMDITALEGISILHREGVSVGETADHLRSGTAFKSSAEVEPDSSSSEKAAEETSACQNEAKAIDNEDGVEENVMDGAVADGADTLGDGSKNVASSIEGKEGVVPSDEKTLHKTLTMTATMEEAKEILKDEDLGKTRSKDPEPSAVKDMTPPEENLDDAEKAALQRTLTMAATLEESKDILRDADLGKTRSRDPAPTRKTKSRRRKSNFRQTIEDGEDMLGREMLGKTRSQDRKRSARRSSGDGQTSTKRKRHSR